MKLNDARKGRRKKKAPVKHKGQTGREMFKMAKKDGGRGRGRCCQDQHFWEELECMCRGGGGQGKGEEAGGERVLTATHVTPAVFCSRNKT